MCAGAGERNLWRIKVGERGRPALEKKSARRRYALVARRARWRDFGIRPTREMRRGEILVFGLQPLTAIFLELSEA